MGIMQQAGNATVLTPCCAGQGSSHFGKHPSSRPPKWLRGPTYGGEAPLELFSVLVWHLGLKKNTIPPHLRTELFFHLLSVGPRGCRGTVRTAQNLERPSLHTGPRHKISLLPHTASGITDKEVLA